MTIQSKKVQYIANGQQSKEDNREEDIYNAVEKLRIKKAKNAESAKKTRDRKKAYVNELQRKLQKQEEKIELLIQSEIKANSRLDSTSDITNFGRYYKDWRSTFDNLINTLQRQISTNNSEAHIELIIKQFNQHYDELISYKKTSAKTCVMSIINVTWMPQSLTTVMWIGGIRPSDIIKLLLNHVELYKDQPERIALLKEETIRKENIINNKVEALKTNLSETFVGKNFINKGDTEAMSNYQNNMFQQIGKLYSMQNYLAEADKLRALVFKDIQKILSTNQKAFAIFTIHQHIKRLESWNNLLETSPIV